MIAPWPPKPRYKTKQLRKAINVTAQTNALTDLEALLAGLDTYSHTAKQTRDIRDNLAAIIDESGRP